MRVLFLFLDGVGLGAEDSQSNPLARANMPTVQRLLNGQRLLQSAAPIQSQSADLLALDACLGVAGRPQSATGQAALLTGKNVPAKIGYHYGPKPNPDVALFLKNGNLFHQLRQQGRRVSFLNAFPPRYFEHLESGRRLPGAIAMAAKHAGVRLRTVEDLSAGQAISPDFTNQGWREHLGFPHIPQYTPQQTGRYLATLAQKVHLAFVEHWPTDLAGHHQDMDAGIHLMESLDGLLAGLLESWDCNNDLILVTSDHGNLEDISHRRHTQNPVPLLLIGSPAARSHFRTARALPDLLPLILESLHLN